METDHISLGFRQNPYCIDIVMSFGIQLRISEWY